MNTDGLGFLLADIFLWVWVVIFWSASPIKLFVSLTILGLYVVKKTYDTGLFGKLIGYIIGVVLIMTML